MIGEPLDRKIRGRFGASLDGLDGNLGASLWAGLGASLWASLGAILRHSLRNNLWDIRANLGDSLWTSTRSPHDR